MSVMIFSRDVAVALRGKRSGLGISWEFDFTLSTRNTSGNSLILEAVAPARSGTTESGLAIVILSILHRF